MTNTTPVAEGETPTTHMGVPLDGTIQDNISDPDGDPFTTALVTDTENGTLTLNPDGTFTYTPEEGYVGTDSFTYSVTDGEIGTEPIQATVTITMTNTLPVLDNDAVTTGMDVGVVVDVLANDSDADGDPLTVDSFTYEGAGTLVLNEDGTFTYTPEEGFVGEDTFKYSATDPEVGAEAVEVTVIITVSVPQLVVTPTVSRLVPGLERMELEISGCPALVKWTAEGLCRVQASSNNSPG
jgi:VCBS repeat-containing protein